MSEVASAQRKGIQGQWVLSVSPWSAGPKGESSGRLGTRDFFLAGARNPPCFCSLALSKQLLFVLSSNYLTKQEKTAMGRNVHFFPGFAPFCTPSHSMLSDSMHFHSSVSGFQGQKGRVCCSEMWKSPLPLSGLLIQCNTEAKGKFHRTAPSLSKIPKRFPRTEVPDLETFPQGLKVWISSES